jgi:gas vesicle protein
MTRTGRIVTTMGAALAGATVGYVAGVFSAPASGRDTRRRLGRRMQHQTDELVHKAEQTLKEARQRFSDVVHS